MASCHTKHFQFLCGKCVLVKVSPTSKFCKCNFWDFLARFLLYVLYIYIFNPSGIYFCAWHMIVPSFTFSQMDNQLCRSYFSCWIELPSFLDLKFSYILGLSSRFFRLSISLCIPMPILFWLKRFGVMFWYLEKQIFFHCFLFRIFSYLFLHI